MCSLVFLPIMIPSFLSPLVGKPPPSSRGTLGSNPPPGKLSDRIGPRLIVATGFILLTPFLILLRLPGKHAVKEVVFFCALLALCGTALAFVITPIMAEITNVVRDLEEKKPGRFGKNGAFAQAVSSVS
jgi:MFS family permease